MGETTLTFWALWGICAGMFVVGLVTGLLSTRELRKTYEKEYDKKHSEIYNTIRRETKNEWSQGWDAAWKSVSETKKAYFVWFREHGYESDQIEEWYKEWLKKPDGLKHYDDGSSEP